MVNLSQHVIDIGVLWPDKISVSTNLILVPTRKKRYVSNTVAMVNLFQHPIAIMARPNPCIYHSSCNNKTGLRVVDLLGINLKSVLITHNVVLSNSSSLVPRNVGFLLRNDSQINKFSLEPGEFSLRSAEHLHEFRKLYRVSSFEQQQQ